MVYGFFAALTVAPVIRTLGEAIGLDVASESALAAGLVMGIMIIPFVSSLSDDAISAVPAALRDASYGARRDARGDDRQVLSRRRCRASSRASCWRSAAPSARP